jgi:hypothetical protein
MMNSLRQHWPEYLMEAAELGIFMVSACGVVSLLDYPGSTLHQSLPSPLVRRLLTGIAMGLTAICIVYSPWGKQSGAHFNPRDGRPMPPDEKANDILHWQTRLLTRDATAAAQATRGRRFPSISAGVVSLSEKGLGISKGFLVRDPDGVMNLAEK